MEPAIVAVISALTSIMVALVGAWVARRKGLPAINAEIEQRNADLIKLLQGSVSELERKLDDSQEEFSSCRAKLSQALSENSDLKERVSLAEGDLVKVNRELAVMRRQRSSRARP